MQGLKSLFIGQRKRYADSPGNKGLKVEQRVEKLYGATAAGAMKVYRLGSSVKRVGVRCGEVRDDVEGGW